MKTMVVFPDEVGAQLKRQIPIRSRSRFIADAVSLRLKKERFGSTLQRVAGTWTDARHPELRTKSDVARYLSRFRSRFARPA